MESALHTLPEGKAGLDLLMQRPAIFPFALPPIIGSLVLSDSSRIDLYRYGLDEEFVMLKGTAASCFDWSRRAESNR